MPGCPASRTLRVTVECGLSSRQHVMAESRTIIVIASEEFRERGESLVDGIASATWGDGGPTSLAIWFEPWREALSLREVDAAVIIADGTSREALDALFEDAAMRTTPLVLIDSLSGDAPPRGCLRLPPDISDACIAAATLAYIIRTDDLRALERELRLVERVADGVQAELTRLDEELQMASLVQQEFLPRIPPAIEGVEFAALWRPASAVSGDLYDIVRLDERRVGVFLADAVGHGVPAALQAMLLCRALETKDRFGDRHGQVERILPPAEALSRLNSTMASRQGRMGRYAAAMYAIVDCRERTMRVASAGGPPPLVLSRTAGLRVLPMSGPLLGLHATQEFEETMIELAPGDRILFHSDGFEQAFRDGGELMDMPELLPRYLEEFAKLRDVHHADEAVKTLANRLDHEHGSLHPSDDCTMVMVQAAAESLRLAA
jgi:sigma-B regulation protein RsbU (phosphoserine phosphatase)